MLEALLRPKSIAIIGASRTPGKVGHAVLANLIQGGFAGKLIPVNPTTDEIRGRTCYHNLAAAETPIDLGIVVVPPKAVVEAISSCAHAGAKAIILITAGFKEVGEAGAKLEEEVARLCRSHGIRLLGPNCLGLINTENHMNASFATQMPAPGGISVVSQSGALCTAILDWSAGRGVGLAKLVSIGNKADLNEVDLLSALAEDDQTKVIACYLESITAGDQFIKVAESVTSIKPVVVLKAGTTAAGGKAASSHTGSLAGADIAYGAAFRRAGVIRAENFESLFDIATALSMQPLPKGRRVAIITNAGGPGIMAADAVENVGLEVKPLAESTSTALKQRLPAAASVGNPIDVLGDADPERYATALDAALSDETVEAVVVILTPQAMSHPEATAEAIVGSLRDDKPVLASFMGGLNVLPAREELAASNLPDYPSPERAVAALHAMYEYSLWRRRPPRVVTRFPVNRRRVERIIARHLRSGRREIGEVDAKDVLRAYDFTVPEGRIARSAEEAVAVADTVGYPVAMKIVSPDIVHKSDYGGVRLSLSTPNEVRDAYDLMMLRIGRRAPEAELVGVYVEEMCRPGREVILGMHRDPQFGPMLMFGLGGIFVEVMKDVSFYLAPITRDEALRMLQSTRSYALLRGARGEEAVDLEALAGGLQRISQLVTDFPQILEMDINPFIVGATGAPPVVADARMSLSLDEESQ
ncbi:MAG: acetate--CoA ligase family protein [Candidatus Omnitrophica bacterium]|nr:Protein lysine acetyltransferase Pat [bacterium]NUN95523.1 acetate--CoA ligase family protein [Candidatus Omnitrophota bacterium]